MLNSITLPSIADTTNRGGSFNLVQRRFIPSGRTLALLGLLVFSCTAVLVLKFWMQVSPRRSDERESLVSDIKWLPNCPGRLVGGFWPQSAQIHIEKRKFMRLLLTLHRSLAIKLKGPRTVELLADMAVVKLAMGQVGQAASLLEQAVARMPQDSEILNDLSAVYLARFKSQGDPQDLVFALAMADRAIAAAPDLTEAYFNRALSLELLFLRSEAASAWDAYQELDPDSPWAREAARYIDRRTVTPDEQEWEKRRAEILNLSEQEISTLVRRFPQSARIYAEERLLTEWGIALNSGDQERARVLLRVARAVAESLARMSGDRLLQDSVAVVDEALSSPPRLAILAAGHAQYGNALYLLEKRQYADAAVQFMKARRDLARGGSPFASWPLTQIAVCKYQQSAYQQAFSSLEQVLSEVADRGYLTIEARAFWVRGTILIFVARSTESLAAYRKACGLYLKAREVGHAAALHTRLARNLESLGNKAGAWQHRYKALQDLIRSSDPDRRRVMMGETAWGVLNMGYPGVAHYFQEEAVRAAEERGDPGGLAVAHRQLSEILFRFGDLIGAVRELEAARQHAQAVGDPGLRTTVETEIAMLEGQVKREREPEAALAAVNSALKANLTLGDRIFLPDLYLQRVRINRLRGDFEAAEDDLRLAIQVWEEQKNLVEGEEFRLSFFVRGRSIFDEMIDFQFRDLDRPDVALEYADLAKSQLFDLPWSSSPVTLRSQLPKGLFVLEYAVLPDRTFLWLLNQDKVVSRIIEVRELKLQVLINKLQVAARSGNTEAIKRCSAPLFEILLRPVVTEIRDEASLLVIPDRALSGLPFGALFDRSRDSFVIERWIVAFSPYLDLRVQEMGRDPSDKGLGVALVVADPAFRRDLFPSLSRLRRARLEGESVAARFPGALLLTDNNASSERFLQEVDRHEIVHFAGHSVTYPGQPFRSELILAPGIKSVNSGVVSMADLRSKNFRRVRLVTLSSCSSAAGDVEVDQEGLLGLSIPFLSGGVSEVVASLWPIKDREAALFFEDFYRHFVNGAMASDALREVVIGSLRKSKGEGSLGASLAFVAISVNPQQLADRGGAVVLSSDYFLGSRDK